MTKASESSPDTVVNSFANLKLMEPILRAVKEAGYEAPTPIQTAAIPALLAKKDLLGTAQTGTGKTAAFALPILQTLALNKPWQPNRNPRALVLTPTRELALQIFDNFRQYGKFLPLKSAVIFGGVGQGPQVKALASGVEILVATPGRLMDLINQRHLSLKDIEIFVLDEADRMLDMGFIKDIKKIIALLPKTRQNLFFSATMPKDIQELSKSILNNPVRVEVTPVSSTVELIEQFMLHVERNKKQDLLRHLLEDPALYRVIVFTRTKHGANKVAEHLAKNRIHAQAIHGNKSQNARQNALEGFRKGATRVLVATDIAARGIDIDEISHVINYEIPNIAETYVHRIGRTARAGSKGISISFCDSEEKSFVRDIERLIGKKIPLVTEHPFHSDKVAVSPSMSVGKAKAQIENRYAQRRPRYNKSKPSGQGSRNYSR